MPTFQGAGCTSAPLRPAPWTDPYPNVVDASTIVADITNNRCYNSVGGWSANGLEIPMMNDGGTAIINVSDSSFTNVTSDITEPIALGSNQYLEVNLLRVTAAHGNGQGALPTTAVPSLESWPYRESDPRCHRSRGSYKRLLPPSLTQGIQLDIVSSQLDTAGVSWQLPLIPLLQA